MVSENSNLPINTQQQLVDDTIDIKKIIFKYLNNWYWFILALFLTITVAFLYNRYTTPVYEVDTSLLLEDENSNSSFMSAGGSGDVGLFQGLGMMGSMRNINNQAVILSSTPLIYKTVEKLNLNILYYTVGRVVETESYKNVPFYVSWDKNNPQIINQEFFVSIDSKGKITLTLDAENAELYNFEEDKSHDKIEKFEYSKSFTGPTNIKTKYFSFSIQLNEFFTGTSGEYKFVFKTTDDIVNTYKSNLTVERPRDETSILHLVLNTHNTEKGKDFLATLIQTYQQENLSNKNENANRTISFIDSQLQSVSDSLNRSENRMESFQSRNQVLNLSLQSEQLLNKMEDIDKQRIELETKNKYYHYLRDYMLNNQDLETVVAPSAMGIADPLLNSLILKLNELLNEKSSQTSIRKGSDHPTILRLNAQIENVKKSLLENTNSIISQSEMTLSNLNKRIRKYETEIRRLPATERNYVSIERKYKLNNEIYTFLLQKLSEAQIAQASNLPDGQVIEEPNVVGSGPVKPRKMIIYAIALLLGLILPAVFIFLKDFFSNTVKSQDDIESVTNIPIVGYVFDNETEEKNRTLVLDNPNSPLSEPYRAIRNKLSLITKGKDRPIIAVTSTAPNEGKSYNAINVASSFALIKKKTILLDLDLRNSRLKKEFGIASDKGVVDYIIGNGDIDDITFNTKHPFLKFIPAGPIPPNPGEMLTDDQLIKLIKELRKIYDVIVIDTAPVGYVTDLFQLYDIIDANLFVVSHNKTHKMALKNALEEVEKHQLKGLGIIVNKIKIKSSKYRFRGNYGYGYGYGYSYGYGYGYGYGNSNKNEKKSTRKVLRSEDVKEL